MAHVQPPTVQLQSNMSTDLKQRKDAKDFVCYFMEITIKHLSYDRFLALLLQVDA